MRRRSWLRRRRRQASFRAARSCTGNTPCACTLLALVCVLMAMCFCYRYVLEKFVGKFDVIYPKEKPLGYCGKEAIWPRSALHHLHTQDGWLKEGRQVRIGETPIKRVPKRQRKKKEGSGEELKALDTELFGLWCAFIRS